MAIFTNLTIKISLNNFYSKMATLDRIGIEFTYERPYGDKR